MTPSRRRAILHGLTLSGLLFTAYIYLVLAPQAQTFGFDTFAYWSVSLPHPYTIPLKSLGSFPYSPPAALLFDLFGSLPWSTFVFAWACFGVGTVLWLGGRWSAVLFAFPPIATELYHGNIHLFLAAAIALGYRYPAAWAFVLLTKPTAGIGLLWFLVRGEWRSLAIATATAGAIAAASLLMMPSLWAEWFVYLMANPSGTPGGPSIPVPLPLRLLLAAVIVIWGARTDRPWTVAVAATIALPVLWYSGFAVLAGAMPGMRAAARSRAAERKSASVISPGDDPGAQPGPTQRPAPATIASHASGSWP